MGRCVICGKETNKTVFKKAIVHTYICSTECLVKYFKHKVTIQETLDNQSEERDYWTEQEGPNSAILPVLSTLQ